MQDIPDNYSSWTWLAAWECGQCAGQKRSYKNPANLDKHKLTQTIAGHSDRTFDYRAALGE